jgi:adenylate cyclase
MKEILTKPDEKKTIAILPLNLIGVRDEENAGEIYLTIGLADAFITRLSNVSRFVVRPTSSVLRFQHGATDAFHAGRELGVEFVLEGTIRRVRERIRVSIQLLSVEKNSVIWAEKFDENFTDVLELEDSISERVAKSLIPELTGEEEKQLQKRGTNSPEAYEAFLRGRYFANQFNDDSLPNAIEAYREAIRLDPNYALPHVGVADFYVLSAMFGATPCHEGYPKAKEELRLALKADDSLAEAYSLLSFIALLYDWDWAEAAYLIKRTLKLNPNYHLAHDGYAHILASQGIFKEAITEIKRSEEFDPLSPRGKLMTSCICYQTGQYDLGAAKAEEAVAMQQNSPTAFLHLGNSLTHNGNGKRAVEVLSASARIWANSDLPKYMLCFALVADERREEAQRVLDSIAASAKTQYVKPYFVAMAYTALGEIDSAFEWFEKSIEERDDWMIWFGTDIKLDALRKDARYFEILRKTNNPIITRQLQSAKRD